MNIVNTDNTDNNIEYYDHETWGAPGHRRLRGGDGQGIITWDADIDTISATLHMLQSVRGRNDNTACHGRDFSPAGTMDIVFLWMLQRSLC